MTATPLVLEEDDTRRGYKRVHVEGCRDVSDPCPIGQVVTLTYLVEALGGFAVFDDLPPDEWRDEARRALAPCAARVVVVNR